MPTNRKATVAFSFSDFSYQPAEGGEPHWNVDPLFLPRWLDHLEEWLPDHDRDFATLVEHNMILTNRGGIIVSSLEDAAAVSAGTAHAYTFDKPSPVRPLSAAIATTPPVAAADAKDAPKDSPAASPTTVLPDRVSVSPYHIQQCDKRGMNAILGTISIQSVRNALKARCANSGRQLLRILHADRHLFMTDKGSSAVENIMDKILEVGLTELSVTTFSVLSDEYEGWNRAQLPALRVPASTIVKALRQDRAHSCWRHTWAASGH